MPGIPFQSKLEPFYDFIRECRAKRWSYVRIAQAITHDHGVKVSSNAVFSFVKVRAKRRKLYALPPLHDFGFAAADSAASPPAGNAAVKPASDFFASADPSDAPDPREVRQPRQQKHEKRPYRLEF